MISENFAEKASLVLKFMCFYNMWIGSNLKGETKKSYCMAASFTLVPMWYHGFLFIRLSCSFLKVWTIKSKLSEQIVSEIRKTVESLGFVEVETPVLQVRQYLHGFFQHALPGGGGCSQFYVVQSYNVHELLVPGAWF